MGSGDEWVEIIEEWNYLKTEDFWWNITRGAKLLWGGFSLMLFGSCYLLNITETGERKKI